MATPPDRQPFTPDDLWAMRFITDMRLAPDERRIAYCVEWNDRAANERRQALWLLDTQTGATRRLTTGGKSDTRPRWSPDGRWLAFVRVTFGDGDEGPQLWVMPMAGGEARQLTHMRRGVSAPFWSADSRWIGFESEGRPGEQAVLLGPLPKEIREREQKDAADAPRHITRLHYRWDGRGYFEGRTQLFRVVVEDAGEPQAIETLTEGDYDSTEGACSPDGRSVVFVSDRAEDRDANMTSDLWLLDLATRGLRQLTDGAHGVASPVWSPDGGRIAYLASPKIREHSAYNVALMALDVANGGAVNLLPADQRQRVSFETGIHNDIPSPDTSAPIWAADGAAVYALALRRGGVDLLRVAVDGGLIAHAIAGDDAHIEQFALAPATGRVFALRCDPTRPWDVWEYAPGATPDTLTARPLTSVNDELLAARLIATPERFTFRSSDDWEIDAWLYRPVGSGVAQAHEGSAATGAQAKRPTRGRARRDTSMADGEATAEQASSSTGASTSLAPLVLKIHGGPHGAYGQTFFLRAQVLAGMGYAMLYANPRGSVGYGEAFAQACDGDWGGGDYRDLMAAVDAALARGGLDTDRLAVFGVSYGGYMTNWIVGQTDRFRAAVAINSMSNLISSFGVGDIDNVWAEGDYGWPWERAAWYRERSPLTYAPRVTTPLRIIAAENDYRCPISQSEELYTWLKRLGRAPVDFVRLPGASHTVYASPRQAVRALELEMEWIVRYCPTR
ncbi:MAG TPA: S9 family peptidase [Ktedonobacterales bacterium]|nr:S9 family peptidase [Ktedonobacterales bacterium]